MTTSSDSTNERQPAQPAVQPRDAAHWSQRIPTGGLRLNSVPIGALNLNVEGRQVANPLMGFGPLWQKTYRIRLKGTDIKPANVIKAWKENFPKFWPPGNRFHAPLTGIAPGEVALLNLSMPGGMALSTGGLVVYADEESFTLMTPQGHMFAGWITFSAYEEENDTVIQAQVLMRASDPVYEIGLRLGGHRQEDKFWEHTLKSLAAHLNVDAIVETEVICVDSKLQWAAAKNIRHNAAMRTAV